MLLQIFPNREISVANRRPGRPKGDPPPEGGRIVIDHGDAWESPLDLAPQLSQANNRRAFRRRPLSKPAKHRILKHSALMVPENRKKQVFATGTLPGSTSDAVLEFSRKSGQVVKLVQTYLPRALDLKGTEISYVWVWEHQARGALHIHLAVELPSRELAKRLTKEWAGIWGSILRAVDSTTSVDLFGRWYGGSWADRPEKWVTNCKLVYASVGRYLSKYITKGDPRFSDLRPPRWYGISSSLRKRLRDWLAANTWELPLRLPPSVSTAALTVGVERALKEVCVGDIGSRADRADPCSLWLYGYIREECTTEDCIMAILNEVRLFGDIDNPSPENKAFYKSKGRYLEELRRIIRYEWPTWLWYDVNHMVSEEVTNKLHVGAELTRFDLMDLDLAFRYSVVAGFGSVADSLLWVERTRELLNALI